MRFQHLMSGGALLLLVGIPGTSVAQRVAADVVIHSGPVIGHVAIGERPRRVVVVERYAPRRIHVYGWNHGRYYRDHGRYGRPARVAVYYDPYGDDFYDGYHPDYYRVELISYHGRYYRDWDRGDFRRSEARWRHGHGRGHDRDDRFRDRRDDDRRDRGDDDHDDGRARPRSRGSE